MMYTLPNQDNWSGRTDHLQKKSSFRIHQVVNMLDVNNVPLEKKAHTNCALIGFQCEEGVRRNKGRIGAAKAPDAIRCELAKLPWHGLDESILSDAGNIICEGDQLELAQQEVGKCITTLLKNNKTPIILGGGHETFYGHYLGVRQFIGPDASLGMINIDAHFDLRPYDDQPSSGTMFRQILDQDRACRYLVLGIQQYGNTKELFDTADRYSCQYILEEQLTNGLTTETVSVIEQFINEHDYVMLTLCTDVMSAAHAPGVSAPSAFGLIPSVVRSLIRHVTSNNKTLSFDISEVNPNLDENQRTVKLAAGLVNEAIISFQKEEKQ